MTKINLRGYQIEAIERCFKEILENRRALLSLGTGLGKTLTIAFFIKEKTKKKVLFLANKINLIDQTIDTFKNVLEEPIGRLQGITKDIQRVTVATVQTALRTKNDYDLIILDEAHCLTESIEKWIGEKHCIGMTATSFYIHGDGKFFKRVCFERDIKWAIKNKFLVEPRIKHCEKQFDVSKLRVIAGEYSNEDLENLVDDPVKIKEQVLDAISRLDGYKKIAWACVSIKHAEAVNSLLVHIGQNSVCVHSKGNPEDFDKFKTNDRVRHVVFVTQISTGTDYPPIDSIVFMRPTRSTILMIQTIGRSLRLYKNKDHALILDYGNVIENCGTPQNPILKFCKKSSKDRLDIKMKFCPKCLEYLSSNEKLCSCGHIFGQEQRDILKNLTLKPYQEEILTFKAKFYKQYKYKSKSGKIMDRIDYHTTCFMIISEFFRKRFIKDEGVCDVEIDCRKEGKFFNVIRVRNTKSDP